MTPAPPNPNLGLPQIEPITKLESMRELVVEDERKTAAFIRKAMQAEGHAVDVLHDGSEALVAVARTPFDVVVLDIMLAGRGGLSVVRQLRERQNATPVLPFSARGEVSERVEGPTPAPDDRLTKIVDSLTLLAEADTGQLTLALEPVRLDELVHDRTVIRSSRESRILRA